jgi:hypothetical protein
MNIKCYLFGHKPYEHGIRERCDRCGEIEESETPDLQWTFRQRYGAITALRFFVDGIRERRFPRCFNCRKPLWSGHRWRDSQFCSEQCAEECIPF